MIDGEAARVITEAGAGLACASGNAKALAEITFQLATATIEKRVEMGDAGRKYYLENYFKPTLMSRLEELFKAATLRKGS